MGLLAFLRDTRVRRFVLPSGQAVSIYADLRERFWAKVDLTGDGCWEWTSSTNGRGYGTFRLGGHVVRAHRVAYTIKHGAIPDGLVLDHLCCNKACVRPDHLEAVTQQVNSLRGRRTYARQTHCAAGHAFDEANTYVTPSGKRQCRECTRARHRRARNGA